MVHLFYRVVPVQVFGIYAALLMAFTLAACGVFGG